jgi:hypothetical protein
MPHNSRGRPARCRPPVLSAFVGPNFASRIGAVFVLGNPVPDTEAASMFHVPCSIGHPLSGAAGR